MGKITALLKSEGFWSLALAEPGFHPASEEKTACKIYSKFSVLQWTIYKNKQFKRHVIKMFRSLYNPLISIVQEALNTLICLAIFCINIFHTFIHMFFILEHCADKTYPIMR